MIKLNDRSGNENPRSFHHRRTLELVLQKSPASFGALVLCIKLTSSLPVLQIPILNYEINYG